MRAAIVNSNGIVGNVIAVKQLSDYPGAVACPDWISIGMNINDPMPTFINSSVINKQIAIKRLQDTDWVNQQDVYDTARSPHLMNRDTFLTYRSQVRVIAVNPVDGNLDWPVVPIAQWSSAA